MSVLNVLLFGYFTVLASTYRLNVPRVLLPYHPNVQVTFDLTVSDPEDGCFSWRTTRPDVVSIKVLNPIKTSDCSSRARIAATSKYSDEQTAVIFAENKDAGIVLTCGVTVDVIRSIIISTTTKVLFLDASPAKVVIQAYNAEGDMFTNLGEIPFEWHLESSSEKPLRIVPFSQSKYKAPDGVRFLEDNKKRGYVILVEGISTGAASLEAKLIESHFKNVEAQRVDLIVVANLLLVPSQDIYVPLGSYVHYSAEIIKQGITEEITLPAKQYHLVINNSEICSLDTQTSMVVALKYGTTEISIIDENVKSSNTLKPPSARIHVVEPMSLSIKISGDSWYLEKGREYQIFFVIVDDSNHILHVPENANFKYSIPDEYFTVIRKSINGSCFDVKAIKSGVTKLQAAFISLTSLDSERKILPSIKDEVTTTISEPVQVSPPVVVFPYTDDKKMNSAKLSARGGTGSFIWSSENPEIAFIDSSGILSSRKLGKTKVVARDLQNVNHFGQAIVQIVEPAGIAFGTSHIEAEIGNDLVLFVSLYASMGDEKIVISDCRQLNFLFEVQDSNIFKISSQHSPYVSLQGDGCSSFVLTALNSGDTTVTVRLGAMSASILISAYPPLRLETPTELLLLHGSSFYVRTSGGPRPWVLDPSKYYTKLTYSNASALITENASQNDRKIITCRENEGDVKVTIVTGNEASYTNPLPAVAEAKFRVCCGVPSRLLLSLQRSLGNKCPTKVHAVSFSQPSTIVVEAFGHCKSGPSVGLEQQILSLTSLRLNWSLSDSNIAHVDESERGLYSSEIYGILKPQNIVGHVQIFATAYEYLLDGLKHCLPKMLQSKMQITLVENAEALPSTVILLNEKKATKDIRLVGGSGYFSLRPYDTAMLDVKMQTDIAQVRPLTVGKSVLHFTDLCTEKNFTATISISEVEEILIEAPHFVALHSEQNLHLKIRDVEGSFFVTDDANVMDVQVNSSKTAVTLTRIDSLHYTLRGEMTGVVTLRASARRANGQILQSHSHRIQVYAPLQLQPKVITLIPNSVFQLEISGGPQPLPPLHFHLNNTSAADISPNGFITSKIIGYTEIIGSVDLENNAPIQDKVIVRTVLLSGVRIRLSTLRIQVGEKAWARLDGLTEDQTPFSFGGALYPLHIYWTIATPGIIEAVSPFGALVSESSENRFQIEVKALAAGQAVIRLSVNISTFLGGFPELIQHYDDEIILTVIEPIQLIKPVLHPEVLRISPDAELTLKSNRKDGLVQFIVPSDVSTYVSVIGDTRSILKAHSVGDAALILKEMGDMYEELLYLPVSVSSVTSLHFKTDCSELPKSSLSTLPLGYHLHVEVESRDHLGRLFDASKHSLRYRPNRFDLTEIHAGNENKAFDIHLNHVGETVFKVWDNDNQELSVYLRVPVSDVIEPSVHSVVLYDIVCFKSPLPTSEWKELETKKHFHFVDRKNGIAIAVSTGNSVVASQNYHEQTIFTKRKIIPANSLRFSSVPHFVSNIQNHQYLFSVVIGSDELNSSIFHGCTYGELANLTLNAPFDCSIYFEEEVDVIAAALLSVRSAFLPSLGKYGCVLEELTFDDPFALMKYDKLVLGISAVWNKAGKVKGAKASTTFYSRFEVIPREIYLDNVDTLEAILTIHSSASAAQKIRVETDVRNVLLIEQLQSITPNELLYRIKLNFYSVMLWREVSDNCTVTVRCSVTGQYEEIPVTVVLHGDTSKIVIRVSEHFMGLLNAIFGSTVFQVFMSFITAGFVIILIAYWKGYSFSTPWLNFDQNVSFDAVDGLFNKNRREWYSRSTEVDDKSVLRSPFSSHSTCLSPRGSPGEPILWSVPDTSLTPTQLRRRNWM